MTNTKKEQQHESKGLLVQPIGGQQRLQAMVEASARIAGAGSPEATLQEITDQARRILGAHLAATHNVARAEWPLATVTVAISEQYGSFSGFKAPPNGAGIYTEVVRSKRPIRLTSFDLPRHPGWRGFSEYKGDHPPLRGLLAAPLVNRTGISTGVIMLSHKEAGEFTTDDEAILVQLAQIASISIENALAAEALRQSEMRLRATHENANIAIGECDAQGNFVHVNSGFCSLTGYSRDELLRLSFFDLTHPEDAAAEKPLFERHRSGELTSYSFEKRYIRKGGSTLWVLVSASGVYDPDERFSYGVRIAQDITERKQAEERQDLLLRELHHRVKNTLATVQAVAGSTIRSSASMEQFRVAFTDRLISLGKTHTLLTEKAWGGAELMDLLRLELDPYDNGIDRVKLSGPELHLTADMSVALGMSFHELTTNAVKYGALSVLGGCIEVDWAIEAADPPLLRIVWQERNGPPVTKPVRQGFGTELLQRVLGAKLGRRVEVAFEEEGVRIVIEAVLSQAQE